MQFFFSIFLFFFPSLVDLPSDMYFVAQNLSYFKHNLPMKCILQSFVRLKREMHNFSENKRNRNSSCCSDACKKSLSLFRSVAFRFRKGWNANFHLIRLSFSMESIDNEHLLSTATRTTDSNAMVWLDVWWKNFSQAKNQLSYAHDKCKLPVQINEIVHCQCECFLRGWKIH